MIETRIADRGSRAGLLDQHEQLAPARAQRRAAVLLLQHLQPDRGAVVVERAAEIGDGELDRAHRRLRRDLRARGRTRGVQLLGVERRVDAITHRRSLAGQYSAAASLRR